MGQKPTYAYEVYVGKKSDVEKNVFCYRAFTLDEACGIALGLFRTCNVPDFRVTIYSIVADSDMVSFVKE